MWPWFPRAHGDGPYPVRAGKRPKRVSPCTRGWSPVWSRCPPPSTGFPVHTGMVRAPIGFLPDKCRCFLQGRRKFFHCNGRLCAKPGGASCGSSLEKEWFARSDRSSKDRSKCSFPHVSFLMQPSPFRDPPIVISHAAAAGLCNGQRHSGRLPAGIPFGGQVSYPARQTTPTGSCPVGRCTLAHPFLASFCPPGNELGIFTRIPALTGMAKRGGRSPVWCHAR